MLSAPMLVIIFFEISIAVVTVLGSILVASNYFKKRDLEDLYVSVVLAGGAICDLSMIFSQVAYSLGLDIAGIGFKFFLFFLLNNAIFVWFHVSRIYNFRSKIVTGLLLIIGLISLYLVAISNTNVVFKEGVIYPIGVGVKFFFGSLIIGAIVVLESIVSTFGIKRLDPLQERRYLVSKFAGFLFLMFIVLFFSFMASGLIIVYVLMWVFAFFAMFFLTIFSMLPKDGKYSESPLRILRTRILYKLVLVMVLMIILSMEGMGLMSITIAKSALSQSIIEDYKKIAVDTLYIIERTKIDTSTELTTLKGIAKVLEGTKIGSRGAVFLLSPSKRVYINRADNWVSLGGDEAYNITSSMKQNKSGGEVSLFGEKVIAAYIPIPNLDWYIIVGQPVDYAYLKIKQMEGTFIIFILFWISITVLVGIYLARNIEGPIKDLKQGILHLAEGDLSYKVNSDKIDEVGELAQTFNQMSGDLKQSQDSLLRSERLSSLGYMAAGMAHEIKNALVPLRTLTDMLQVSGGDQSFIKKFNDLVPKEIERINRLSSDLLHYSRPMEPVFEYLDINEVIEESAKFLDIQARKKNVNVRRQYGVVSEVKADRQKLIETFTNIILNAIEAMTIGGQINISTYEKENNVIVELSDNGPGIPEENLKKIFVPFFTTKKEGTGIGLAIVSRVIQDHGGSIDIMSKHGKGTTFFLSFPKKP
jgi:signal transduction histidine kinase